MTSWPSNLEQSPVRYSLIQPERPVGRAWGGGPARGRDQPDIRLVRDDGTEEAFTLPTGALPALADLLDQLASSDAVTVFAEDTEITPEEAAGILGMSRPLVRRRMDTGLLPSAASAPTGASGWPTRWHCAHARNRCAKRWRRSPPIPRILSARMEFEGPGRPPPVVPDANLLYPFHLRNLLVQIAVDCIITLRWTGRTMRMDRQSGRGGQRPEDRRSVRFSSL